MSTHWNGMTKRGAPEKYPKSAKRNPRPVAEGWQLFGVTAAVAGAVMLAVTAGCAQNIVYREFYEPNEKTLLKRDDGTTVGAVKAEATKTGAPNWSDNKTLSISVLGL